ncbi:DUF4855 domain-containing protein [Alicyclobacillus sp. TC]|uniref:DUF4855 domain-containing protein n=1 Tax=Alicyclobacillus sp. TC TaxID=2606450 RepID=UPI001932D961|nr:DUF4855 domain-containing protein [Alicyclobacillus sp. TC]
MKRQRVIQMALASLSSVAWLGVSSWTSADAASIWTNLASQATLKISVTGYPDQQFAEQEDAYQGNLLQGSAWQGFSHQGGRELDIHLPQPAVVHALSIGVRQYLPMGIYYPSYVQFEVRENGVWHTLGRVYNDRSRIGLRDSSQRFTLYFPPTQGQTFRILFPVHVWVFARQIACMGTYQAVSDAKTANDYPISSVTPANTTGQALTPASANQIENMLLVNVSPDSPLYTSSQFASLVAYDNQQNEPVAPFFNTILFLADGSVQDNKSAWNQYLGNLFSSHGQLAQLQEAVYQDNAKLGTPNAVENVVLTLPSTPYNGGDFGEIDGQDLSFNPTLTHPFAVQAREAAIQWFLQKAVQDFAAGAYPNLRLAGFYWQREDCPSDALGEKQLIQYSSALLAKDKLPLLWIPFYAASGVTAWEHLGFQAAWLQPNYAELGNQAFPARLTNAADIAERYGMGLELEWTRLTPNGETLYVQQLQQFAADGLGQGVSHAFYDGANFLSHAEASANPFTRAIYDDTYDFVSGQYNKIGAPIQ